MSPSTSQCFLSSCLRSIKPTTAAARSPASGLWRCHVRDRGHWYQTTCAAEFFEDGQKQRRTCCMSVYKCEIEIENWICCLCRLHLSLGSYSSIEAGAGFAAWCSAPRTAGVVMPGTLLLTLSLSMTPLSTLSKCDSPLNLTLGVVAWAFSSM